METFDKALSAFDKGTRYSHDNVERLGVPYGDQLLPALFTRAKAVNGAAPTVVYLNGLDSCKELLYVLTDVHFDPKLKAAQSAQDTRVKAEALRCVLLSLAHSGFSGRAS
ncbi:MAG: hypothetical protein AB8B64_25045 [Granulosicoccus sp.]